MQQGTQTPSPRRGRRPRIQTNAHVLGADLARGIRADVAQWVSRLKHRPAPQSTLINVESGRSASLEVLSIALAACASSSASRESIAQFCRQLYVRLRAMAPIQDLCPDGVLERELIVQGPADLAQHRARKALETNNRADLERAIDESVAHRDALDDLIDCLIARVHSGPAIGGPALQFRHVS